ncbi:MAG: hypothetical protein JW795_05820, partial [Chitinivibrionales bacterium]|nr:hypothetical protein [Chitinivibrionales bacterium]
MTQPQRLFSFFLVIGALHFHCSSPSSSSAAISWHAKYCMPLLNMKMNVHDILTGNQKPSQNLDLDSLHCGDTLQLLYTDTLKTAMKSTIYTVHDTNYQYRLGTLTLRNLPPATVTLKMIDTFISSIPLPKPLSVNLNGETTIPHLEYIQIDESSDSISISIENLSDAVTFDYLIIASLSRADTIVALRIDTPLRPHERIDQKFSGAGKTIFNTINNSISVQVAQGSIIDRSTALKLSLHLNNQTLNEACLSDIYLKYSFSTIIPLALKKDSCIIHYCDVTSLNIPITINNGTPIDFTLNYGIENVFNADYCRSNTIDSIGSLKNMVVDSSWYLGKSLAPVT